MRYAWLALSGALLSPLFFSSAHAAPPQPAPVAIPASSEEAATPPSTDQRETTLRAWLEAHPVAAGACELHALLVTSTHGYAACGARGFWTVEFSGAEPQGPAQVQHPGGRVVGVFRRGGQVWAEISELSARPMTSRAGDVTAPAPIVPAPATSTEIEGPAELDQREPTVAPPPIAVSDADAIPEEGRAVSTRNDIVVIDIGGIHGLRRGDRIAFYHLVQEDFGDGSLTEQEALLAIGIVTTVAPQRAKVRVGLGEHIPVGAVARLEPSGRPTYRLSAPPRSGGVYELDVMGRPFLTLEDLGFGIISSVEFGYRSHGLLHVGLVLDPLSWATAERGKVAAYRAMGIMGLDTDYFEAGVGLGIQTLNTPDFGRDTGTGTAFSQFARLGAIDGLNLTARTDVVLIYREFNFSGVSGQLQIPLARRVALLAAGAGGSVGSAFGELGVRVLVAGNGGPGSVFLKTTIGGGGVRKDGDCPDFEACESNTSYSGPLVGLGAQWRFEAGAAD